MRWRVFEASFHMAQPITVAAMRTCFAPRVERGAFLNRATGVNPWDNERTSVSAGEPRLVTLACLGVALAKTEA